LKKIILVTTRFSFLKSSWWVIKWVYLTIDITWQYLYPPIKLQNSSLFSRDRPWSTATEYNNVAVHCESSAELAMYARREKALDLTEIYVKQSNNILRWNVKRSSQFHTSPIAYHNLRSCDWKLLSMKITPDKRKSTLYFYSERCIFKFTNAVMDGVGVTGITARS